MPVARLLLPLLACWLVSAFVHAASTTEELQASIEALAERNLSEAEQRSARQFLEQAIGQLRERKADEERIERLQAQTTQAPQQTAQLRRDLVQLKARPADDYATVHARTSLSKLEALFNEHSNQLSDWQQSLRDANSQIVSAQTLPDRVQSELATLQTRLAAIDSALKTGREGQRALTVEHREALSAEKAALSTRIRLRRKELDASSDLRELAQAQRDLLLERISRVEVQLDALQLLIAEERRQQSEKAIAELWREAEQQEANTLLRRENDLNLRLSRMLLDATDRRNELTQASLQARHQVDLLAQASRTMDEMLEVLSENQRLSRLLHELKLSLPVIQVERNLGGEIADLRLQQFELNMLRDQVGNPAAYVERLLADEPPEALSDELRQTLLGLVSTRGELLERVSRELSALLSEAINLQLIQTQLHETATTLNAELDEQRFWIPSNPVMDMAWLKSVPERLRQQVAGMPLATILIEFRTALGARPLLFIPLLMVIAGLAWRRQWLERKVDKLNRDIGHIHRDSTWHTPLAVLLCALQALPIALLLALCGIALQMDARGQNFSLGASLLAMAQVWLVFYTVYRVLAPGGVAESHFRWPTERVTFLRRRMRNLGFLLLGLAAVATFAEHQPDALPDDVIGVAIVLGGYLMMAILLFGLVNHRSEAIGRLTGPQILLGILLALLPLILLVAVTLGYYYTALKLTSRLIESLFLLVLWQLLRGVLERGLEVAARNLAWQRLLKQREAGVRDDPEGGEIAIEEEPILDMEQVNQQSLRLLRLVLLTGFLIALYLVWADLFSVLTYLDNITLYEYTSGSGDTASLVPISVRDVLGGLLIVVLAIVLARNLPGLLEILVLSRLNLAQGSAYATTTLLSYTIVSVGFVATLSTLGVSWDKLQWLVAALSVGLGFGLQEIFANFVSGLIILFERPVRIGDVVTLGDQSGTVKRIRIRATTITDFDRKDIIIPNKVFITGQLINWSLTDTITRVTIKVGVAYGSDLTTTRELLLQIADENPRILKEPAPMVYFLSFGASTLDHELRVHVRELGDRNPTIDEVNRRVDELFREHGIEVAFNQVDVHIRNSAGQEIQLVSGATGSGGVPAEGHAERDR